jgi:hypothetical protein
MTNWKEVLKGKIIEDMAIAMKSDSGQSKEELFNEQYSEEDIEEMYVEMWDEMGEIKLGNLSFMPSRIVKELDPIAYRVGLNDFTDSLLTDFEYEEGDFE